MLFQQQGDEEEVIWRRGPKLLEKHQELEGH
jgi:hypothetical protein